MKKCTNKVKEIVKKYTLASHGGENSGVHWIVNSFLYNKWKSKYPTAFKFWEENWDAICPFFSYSEPVRKIMYTTNTIESLNRSYRKYTKTKSVFPSNESLMKCLYLATLNITKKWNGRYRNWDLILGELSIMFEGRI